MSNELCLDLSSSSRLQENKIGDFFDSFYWKRCVSFKLVISFCLPSSSCYRDSVCCGVIYRGLLGEVMIDRRHWAPHTCPAHSARHNNNNNNSSNNDNNNNNNNSNNNYNKNNYNNNNNNNNRDRRQ